MAHAQKPVFVFRRNGRVHLNRPAGRQFSRLLAAEVCASAVVMLDTPCSEVVWRVLATHSIRQFPLHFPSRASPCTITFQLDSTNATCCPCLHWRERANRRLCRYRYAYVFHFRYFWFSIIQQTLVHYRYAHTINPSTHYTPNIHFQTVSLRTARLTPHWSLFQVKALHVFYIAIKMSAVQCAGNVQISGRQGAVVTDFCKMAPNICESSVWNFVSPFRRLEL